MPRWLETDSLSNQDISSALAIGAYTADADRLILVQFFADAVAGNGDYVFYVTLRINGAGSTYVLIPKTTAAAASGETAIGGQSIMIAVRSGDVVTVYLDGLAGDTTTPDTTVRWFELAALRPTTTDRTLGVDSSGNVIAASLATQAKADVNAEVVDVLRTDTIPDSYAADGAQPTIVQSILAIQQFLFERSVSSTTLTIKKPDGSTAAMTFTLNDASSPSSITRSS